MSLAESQLVGKRILVAEDDQKLALAISRELSGLGAKILGPAPTPFYALNLLTRRGADLAVLNVKLYNSPVFELADDLVARGVPIIFLRGGAAPGIPARFRKAPVIDKPFDRETLLKLAVAMTGVVTVPLVAAPVARPLTLPLNVREVEDRLMAAVCQAVAASWNVEDN